MSEHERLLEESDEPEEEEPLTDASELPIEDGDNSQAGGGRPASPVDEDELDDAPELEDEDDS